MIIQVKEEHTDYYTMINGSSDCMVSKAVREVFPNSCIDCGYSRLCIDDHTYSLPEFVTENIKKFMNRETVKPFEFELDIKC